LSGASISLVGPAIIYLGRTLKGVNRMSDGEQAPVACCLSGGEYQTRLAWIENLTRRALRTHMRNDLVLRLVHAPEAAGEVRKLVEQERMCCAFLTFDLDQRPNAVSVTITAPEAARDSVDVLFGNFLSGFGR
jgi:hypothetical protein